MKAVPGRFNDGRTAQSRAVTVEVTDQSLVIRDGDGLLVASWRRPDVRVNGQLPGNQGVRLCCAAEPDARLTVADRTFYQTLAPVLSKARGKGRPWLWGAAAVVALAVAGGLYVGIPAASRALAAHVPLEWERQFGAQMGQGLERQWKTCDAPAGEAALALLVSRVAAPLPDHARPRRVKVVRMTDENAIALPGGHIMIFQGLLQNASGADEIAGVLAHELTHVEKRHVTSAMIRGMGVGLLVTIATGDGSGSVAAAVATLLGNAYSRDDEQEADAGAVRLLAQAGIDPRPMADFFRRMAEKDGSVPEWLSTHPDSASRAEAIARAAATATAPALPAEQWQALKAICD